MISGTDPRPPGFAMLKNLNLTEDEKKFLNGKYTETSMGISSRNIAAVYLTKTIQNASSEAIESNNRLAQSNDRHARAMHWLTGALILVGIAQVIAALI
jgi:hypothetical protein